MWAFQGKMAHFNIESEEKCCNILINDLAL